uniref:Uncharacterized protein n=1 Tax=Panagrolaimus sp. PS1159 TaxID=55785 RepID=A0AC35G0U9_9BILA
MSCKYFYPKYFVFPVKDLDVYPDSIYKADGEIFNASKFFPKLWLYDSLFANGDLKMSTLIPKIYKFDLHSLRINQNLTFADYQKLTSSGSVEWISLLCSTIRNADDSIVTADKLLEGLDNLHTFSTINSNNFLMLQTETVKKIVQHLNGYKKMRDFHLCRVNESFDFALFSDFLLKNETVSVYFYY